MTAKAFGITPPIRDIPEVRDGLPPFKGKVKITDDENNEVIVDRIVPGAGLGDELFEDPLAEKSRIDLPNSPQAMPGPILTFDGILSANIITTFGTTSMPPDTVGDVGPNNYVQATNIGVFRVFDKTGTALTATARISTLFAGLAVGNPCRTFDNGDPVVNYDPMADRWLISQFVVRGATYGQCIAVSQTGDPTGAWYAYFFADPNNYFPDYPHWGVWTDGYYLATHEFNHAGSAYVEAGFFAFNRDKMLVGDPTANFIYFARAATFGHLPTDIDGYMPPAAGTPEMFFEYNSTAFGGTDSLLGYEFVPNYTTPASSTLTAKPALPVAAFDPRQPSGRNVIEQPSPALATQYVDTISDRNMFRIAYRNLGTIAVPINSYVTSWTVNVSGVNPITSATHQAAIRWEELRRSNAGAMSVFDQGTHAPDPASGIGRNRWMSSIAQDNNGNIAIGFSRSGLGAADFPDIVWAGRTGGQVAAGTLNEGEATMFASTGVQQIANGRWGDYSTMTVDPTDDCTFWYSTIYRDSVNNGTGSSNGFKWSTSIGNFKFPSCTAQPKGQIATNITSCATGLPIDGASVTATVGNFFRLTNAGGTLVSNIIAAPDTYNVSISKSGYTMGMTTATVTDGGTTTVTLCLNSPTAANASVAGRVITRSGRGISNALVTLTNFRGENFTAATNPFGYFNFSELATGETYIVNIRAKRYQFAPQVLTLNEDLTGVSFTALQ
ncbi:MAG: carboxypeptidase-like regulatory domain-containing protein [Pyrinomonadaceae bacterium]